MTDSFSTGAIMERWRPGSGGWDWPTEWANIVRHQGGKRIARLIKDIAVNRVATPILLGDDGHVWDGHHQLLVARLLDIATVPVEYGHGGILDPVDVEASELFATGYREGSACWTTRTSGGEELLGSLIDVPELAIPVRVLASLHLLAGAL